VAHHNVAGARPFRPKKKKFRLTVTEIHGLSSSVAMVGVMRREPAGFQDGPSWNRVRSAVVAAADRLPVSLRGSGRVCLGFRPASPSESKRTCTVRSTGPTSPPVRQLAGVAHLYETLSFRQSAPGEAFARNPVANSTPGPGQDRAEPSARSSSKSPVRSHRGARPGT